MLRLLVNQLEQPGVDYSDNILVQVSHVEQTMLQMQVRQELVGLYICSVARATHSDIHLSACVFKLSQEIQYPFRYRLRLHK